MVSCLSKNIVSGVGWYVENGAFRHMIYDKMIFNKFQEQGGPCVELGDDVIYLVKGLGSISFQIPLSDILELDFVLYVPKLTKSLLSFSCVTNLQCLAKFDGQQFNIKGKNQSFVQRSERRWHI